jgi:hypothetical protein
MPIIPIPGFRRMPSERFLFGKIIGVARIVCNGQETLLREYSTRLRLDPKRERAKCESEVCGVEAIEHPFCLLACSCSS